MNMHAASLLLSQRDILKARICRVAAHMDGAGWSANCLVNALTILGNKKLLLLG